MRYKPGGLWIALSLLLVVLGGFGIYGYVTYRRFQASLQQFQQNGWGAVALNLRPGDHVPPQGRIISSIPIQGTKGLTPDASIALYPGALVQGAIISPSGTTAVPDLEAIILLGTDDPEQKVLDWYAQAWKGLPVILGKPQPRRGLYAGIAPTILSRGISVKPPAGNAWARVQRGPAIQPMDAAQCEAWGETGRPPVAPGGKTMTEIWLTVAVR